MVAKFYLFTVIYMVFIYLITYIDEYPEYYLEAADVANQNMRFCHPNMRKSLDMNVPDIYLEGLKFKLEYDIKINNIKYKLTIYVAYAVNVILAFSGCLLIYNLICLFSCYVSIEIALKR